LLQKFLREFKLQKCKMFATFFAQAEMNMELKYCSFPMRKLYHRIARMMMHIYANTKSEKISENEEKREKLIKGHQTQTNICSHIHFHLYTHTRDILSFCIMCKWINDDDDAVLWLIMKGYLTSTGKKIEKHKNPTSKVLITS
jgi:hypothetical protein